MPLYEFACQECRGNFEEITPAEPEARAEVACPQCGSRRVRRKLSAVASRVMTKPDAAPAAGGCASGQCCGMGN